MNPELAIAQTASQFQAQPLPSNAPSPELAAMHQQIQSGQPLSQQQQGQLQAGANGQTQDPYAQLGSLVQAKYAQYREMDASQVGQLVAKKYPQYQKLVDGEKPGQLQDTGSLMGNAVNSVGNLIGGTLNAVGNVFNPNPDQNTVANLGRLGLGLGENVANLGSRAFTGENVFNDKNTQTADAAAQYLNNRWGLTDLATGNVQGALGKIQNTLYTDPAGAALDLSMILGGAGTVAKGIGEAGNIEKATQVGALASKVGEAVNPFNLAGKGIEAGANLVGKGVAGVLGNTSGIGYGTAQKFLSGDQTAAQAMRSGEITEEGLVQSMQDAYKNIRAQQLKDYQESLKNIGDKYRVTNLEQKGNSAATVMQNNKLPAELEGEAGAGKYAGQVAGETFPLSLQGVRSTMTKSFGDFNISIGESGKLDFSQSVLPRTAYSTIQHIYDDVREWSDTSPLGINNLENKISNYYSLSNEPALNRFISQVGGGLKSYLRSKIPEFQEADANFAKVSQLMKRVKRELNVGGTAQPQTILNKVLKVANNDQDMRNALLKEMSNVSGKDIEGLAAGIKAHNVMPGGVFSKGLELFGIFHPQLFIPLLTTSPRLAAEFLRGIGLGAEKVKELSSAIKASSLATGAAQSSNLQKTKERTIQVRVPR